MNNGQQGMTREFLTGQGLSTQGVLRQQGFTLVEMMIVVVIMAIIASIAVPSYQNNIRKANRADGMDMALEVAQRMERCFTAYSAYNNANCPTAATTSTKGHYSIAVSAAASAFTVTATASSNQQKKDTQCKTFAVDQTGKKTATDASNAATTTCW